MNKKKVSLLKEKIKSISLELFNSNETLSITTNHIAKSLGISVGNLYYHYKNKEEIIKDIYLQMSSEFEDDYGQIKTSKYSILLWANDLFQANQRIDEISKQGYQMQVEGIKQSHLIYIK